MCCLFRFVIAISLSLIFIINNSCAAVTPLKSGYYFVTVSEYNDIEDRINLNEYLIMVNRKYGKYFRIIIRNVTSNYCSDWSRNGDSIVNTLFFNSGYQTEKWGNTNSNYLTTLNNLELFSQLPGSEGFANGSRGMTRVRSQDKIEYFSTRKRGMVYCREWKKTHFIDSFVLSLKGDISYEVSYKIRDLSFLIRDEGVRDSVIKTLQHTELYNTIGPDSIFISELLNQKLVQHDYVLLDFWYIHCQPCRKQLLDLKDLDSLGDNLQIVGLNVYDDEESIQKFKERFNLSFDLRSCPRGATRYLSISSYPTTLLYNKQKKLIFRTTGTDPNLALTIMQEIKSDRKAK